MSYVVDCPACSQKFRVREEFAGRRFRCPKCGNVNDIEAIDVESPEPVPERKSDADVPVHKMLPPVAAPVNRRKTAVEEDAKDDIDYELLGGRVGVLGKRDDEEDEANQRVMRQMSYAFAGLLVLLIAGGVFLNRWKNSPDRLIPKEFETYTFKQGDFLVDIPTGWEVKALGGSNGIPPTLTLKGPKVTFQMRANPRGTILGGTADTLAALGGGLDEGDTSEGVHVAHVAMGTMIANEYASYEETPPQVIRPAGFGSARICEYEGGTPFGTTEYGLRGTVKTGAVAYRILIQMPHWLREDFTPVAKKILASVRPTDFEDFDAGLVDDEDEDNDRNGNEDEGFRIDPFTGERVPVDAEAAADESE